MKQVRDKGVPSSYHHGKAVSSLVDDCQTMHPPPALKLNMDLETAFEIDKASRSGTNSKNDIIG